MTGKSRALAVAALGTAVLGGCDDGTTAARDRPGHDAVTQVRAELGAEDGLAEAYGIFRQRFVAGGHDRRFRLRYGFHPGIVTTRLATDRHATGAASLDFGQNRIEATLGGVPTDVGFDLWLVKNVEGAGRTARPEYGDAMVKVGSFEPSTAKPGTLELSAAVSADVVGFDLDQVVVTRRGQHPAVDVVATGARTLLEKRFFRERAGLALDPVTGATLTSVETTDALVARGAHLFFNETFGGNGRTCGTCHRAEDNLTISPELIATLPQSDPLFVAENVPELRELENSSLLRFSGLIKENVDGFEDPTSKFVLRSVPHTLAMSTSMGTGDLAGEEEATPPDFRLGWGGDGSPGRGSLNEFAFGAIIQHFPKRLERKAGVDFRVPTQAELDALEAFQLFSGRQKNPQALSLSFRDARSENGKNVFQGVGSCVICHRDMIAQPESLLVDTDIERILIAAPRDGGFGSFGTDRQGGIGTGRFNVPPLVEAADTGPYFHNNSIDTLEQAIAFYSTDVFFFSPATAITRGAITLTQQQIDDVGAFLRSVNALENLRQTRKRVAFAQGHRGAGNDDLLRVAIADLGDVVDVLEERALNPQAVRAARTARQTLEIALAHPDAGRVPFLSHTLVWLAEAKADLVTANPLNEF